MKNNLTGPQKAAALNLADVLDQYTLSDLGPTLTCREADAVYAFVLAFQGQENADGFLAAHAEGDDEGDQHGTVTCEADGCEVTGWLRDMTTAEASDDETPYCQAHASDITDWEVL